MQKPTDRRAVPVQLTVSSPNKASSGAARPLRLAYLPWVAAAVVGSVLSVLLGWMAVAVLVSAAWLTATYLPPATILGAASQAWLGVHGAGFTLGGLSLHLAPLGLSALVMMAVGAVASFASGQMPEFGAGDPRSEWAAVGLLVGACTVGYSLAAFLFASIVGSPSQAFSCLQGAIALSAVGSLLGAVRARQIWRPAGVPRWLWGLPRAALAGLIGMGIASAVTLAIAVGSHWATVSSLQGAVAPDAVGTVVLALIYLSYLPNMLLWAGSYALGAGITVGQGTLVTPLTSVIGLLPGLPPLGALPTSPPTAGWALLASGVVAGGISGWWLCRILAQRQALPGVLGAAWRGSVAGLASGAAWIGMSWFSRGDLGVGRLVGLGPRFPELLAFGSAPLALGGALVATLYAALRGRADDTSPAQLASDDDRADEPTVAISGPFGLGSGPFGFDD